MPSNVNTAKKILHGQKDKQKHMENCSGIPGVIYNFDNQNLITFEDNFGSKDNLPFVI